MNYRKAKQEDVEQIYELCKKHDVSRPTFGMCFVAEDENKKIVGYSNTMPVNSVEVVSDNPICSVRLFDHSLGALAGMGMGSVVAVTKRDKAKNLLNRYNFKQIFTEMEIWTKEI